jgi:hypothetical protein
LASVISAAIAKIRQTTQATHQHFAVDDAPGRAA